MFESAPQFGGRARGLHWRVNGRELAIDNGQHLMIGAYRETLALLKLADAPRWNMEPLRWCAVSHRGQIEMDWKVSDRAWPWRALMAMLPGHQPVRHGEAWPLTWRYSLLRVVRSVNSMRSLSNDMDRTSNKPTAKRWLQSLHVPPPLIDGFWKPLTEGALNTEFDIACAQVLANVIHDSLCGPAGATSVITPPVNLSVDGVDPIVRWLSRQQVTLLTAHRVTEMRRKSDALKLNSQSLQPHNPSSTDASFVLSVSRSDHQQFFEFDQVVMALPFGPTLKLWDHSCLPSTQATLRLRQLNPRAITTVWIALNAQQEKRLAHLPTWFVLQQEPGVQQFAQVIVKRMGVIAAVISARVLEHIRSDQSALSLQLAEQLQHALGIDIRSCPQKWITEKRATWAATPQLQWTDPSQAGLQTRGVTGVEGLWRCADDLEPGYPATIESAVRSGCRTAKALLAHFGANDSDRQRSN